MDDIRDVKAPVDLPPDYHWLWFALAVLLVALLVFFLVRFLKKKQQTNGAPTVVLPAWEIALQHLNELSSKGLIAKGEFKEYYFLLSNILRHYIENRFNIRAPEMTTEEFLNKVKEGHTISSEYKITLKSFMNEGDMVKFAKYVPSTEDAQRGFDLVLKFIMDTKETAVEAGHGI